MSAVEWSVNTVFPNTEANQLYEMQNEVKRKITNDYEKEKPIKNEFMGLP
jgi:hypothetical protein